MCVCVCVCVCVCSLFELNNNAFMPIFYIDLGLY